MRGNHTIFIILSFLSILANAKTDYDFEKARCEAMQFGLDAHCMSVLNEKVRVETEEAIAAGEVQDKLPLDPVQKPSTVVGTTNPDLDPQVLRGAANTTATAVSTTLKNASHCLYKELINECSAAVTNYQQFATTTKDASAPSQQCTLKCNIKVTEPKRIDGCSQDKIDFIRNQFLKLAGGSGLYFCNNSAGPMNLAVDTDAAAGVLVDPVYGGGFTKEDFDQQGITPANNLNNTTTSQPVANADGTLSIMQPAAYGEGGNGLLAVGEEKQTFVPTADGSLAFVNPEVSGYQGAQSLQPIPAYQQTPDVGPIPQRRPETPAPVVAETPPLPVRKPTTVEQKPVAVTPQAQPVVEQAKVTPQTQQAPTTNGSSNGNSNGGDGSGNSNGGGFGFSPTMNAKTNDNTSDYNNALLDTPAREPVTINKTGSTGSIGGTYLGNSSNSNSKGNGVGSEATSSTASTANGGTEGLSASATAAGTPKVSAAALTANQANLNLLNNTNANPNGLTFATITNRIGEFFSASKSSIYGSSGKRTVASVNPRVKKPKAKIPASGLGLQAAQYNVPGCSSGRPECLVAFITGPNNNVKGSSRPRMQAPQYWSGGGNTRLPAGVTSGREDVMSRLVQFYNDKLQLDEDGFIQAE